MENDLVIQDEKNITSIQESVNKEISLDASFVGKIITICRNDDSPIYKVNYLLDFMLTSSTSDFEYKSNNLNDIIENCKLEIESNDVNNYKDHENLKKSIKKLEMFDTISNILGEHRKDIRNLKTQILDIIINTLNADKKIDHIKATIIKYMINYKM